jgi:hypothetical protein
MNVSFRSVDGLLHRVRDPASGNPANGMVGKATFSFH